MGIEINPNGGDSVHSLNGNDRYIIKEVVKENLTRKQMRVPKLPKRHDFCGEEHCNLCFHNVVENVVDIEVHYELYEVVPVLDAVLENKEQTKVITVGNKTFLVKRGDLTTLKEIKTKTYLRRLVRDKLQREEQEMQAKLLSEALESPKQEQTIVAELLKEYIANTK